jgi:hypothetical protein
MTAARDARSNGAGGSAVGSDNEKLSSGERKILTALAQYPEGRTKVQVAVLTGYVAFGWRVQQLPRRTAIEGVHWGRRRANTGYRGWPGGTRLMGSPAGGSRTH